MSDRAGATDRPLSFFVCAGVAAVLIEALLHARVHTGIALPSAEPGAWFALGAAWDILVFALLALIAQAAGLAFASAKLARILFLITSSLVILLSLVQSEATIMFGGPIGTTELEGGGVIATIRSSLTVESVVLVVVVMLFTAIALLIATRLSLRLTRRKAVAAGLCLVTIAAFCVATLRGTHQASAVINPLVALVTVARSADGESAGTAAYVPPRRPDDPLSVREMTAAVSPREYFSDEFPLAYHVDAAPRTAVERPNIVIIALENLRTAEVGAYGSALSGITPNIDRLAREGIRVDRAWSAGTRTPMGELALWYGVLTTPGGMLLSERPETPLVGLPEILRANGWRTLLWMSSTDQTFYRRDRFYGPRGFQMFDGTSFPETDPRVNWGISDKSLMRRAVAAMNRIEEPFAAMVLTVNNHHPYQVPEDATNRLGSLPEERFGWSRLPGSDQLVGAHASQMTRTIHYTDEAVGLFFQLAATAPWFDRTVFVITGDHGIAVSPLGEEVTTEHRLSELRHLVPLIFYSPLLEGGRTVAGPASHVDVMPTVLRLAGIETGTGVGTDLLDELGLPPGRPVFAWSESDRRLTIAADEFVYSCRIGGGGGAIVAGSERLVDTGSDPAGEADVSRDYPERLSRFRSWATIYSTVYPWIVASGRSGLPRNEAGRPE